MKSLRRVDTLICLVLLAAGLPEALRLIWAWVWDPNDILPSDWTWDALEDVASPGVRHWLWWFVWFLEKPGVLVPLLLCAVALGRLLATRWLLRWTLIFQAVSALVLGRIALQYWARRAGPFGSTSLQSVATTTLYLLAPCVVPLALMIGERRLKSAAPTPGAHADSTPVTEGWGHWPAARAMTRLAIVAGGVAYAMRCYWIYAFVSLYDWLFQLGVFHGLTVAAAIVSASQLIVWPVLLVVLGLRMKANTRSLRSIVWYVCIGETIRWPLLGSAMAVLCYWPGYMGLPASEWPVRDIVAECFRQCGTTLVVGVFLWYWWPLLRLRDTVLLDGEAPVCFQCGYNLTGNTSGRCPECGTMIQVLAAEPPPAGGRDRSEMGG